MPIVATNITTVLDAFQTALQAAHITGDPLPVVYDSGLDYVHAVEGLRSRNRELADRQASKRLLIYDRGVIQPSDYATGGRVIQSLQPLVSPPNNVTVLQSFYGVLPIRFVFVTPNMRELEQFEIGYMTNLGIKKVEKLQSNFPLLDDPLEHHIRWGLRLASIDLQYTDTKVYRQMVQGVCEIYGYFMVVRDDQSPSHLIEQINLTIQNEELAIMVEEEIFPPMSV